MEEYEKKYVDSLINNMPQATVKAFKELYGDCKNSVQWAKDRLEKFENKLEEAKKKINL
jgi:hypothetical protein